MHSLFVALGQSALGRYMQTSVWGFAVVEAIHLLAIAVLGGSVLIIDLRLLGVILRKEPARVLSRDLGRLLFGKPRRPDSDRNRHGLRRGAQVLL